MIAPRIASGVLAAFVALVIVFLRDYGVWYTDLRQYFFSVVYVSLIMGTALYLFVSLPRDFKLRPYVPVFAMLPVLTSYDVVFIVHRLATAPHLYCPNAECAPGWQGTSQVALAVVVEDLPGVLVFGFLFAALFFLVRFALGKLQHR
jgi:hypothetical protein